MHQLATAVKEVHFALLNAPYIVVALVLLFIEVLIALFVTDAFVRGYVGDMLAVALVYVALRAVTAMSIPLAMVVTLAIALAIEIAQAANLLGAVGLGDNRIARIVLGGVFDWLDIGAYLVGGALTVGVERIVRRDR